MALTLGGYDRIIRHRGNGIEAVEIVWHPGTRTPKHNHGSRGWAWVLQGRVFEVRNGKKLYHAAGDAFLEVDREEAHIVGNDTNELAVTFHVYQPELQMDMFSDSELDIVAMDLSEFPNQIILPRFQPRNFRPAKRATTDALGRADGQCWMERRSFARGGPATHRPPLRATHRGGQPRWPPLPRRRCQSEHRRRNRKSEFCRKRADARESDARHPSRLTADP